MLNLVHYSAIFWFFFGGDLGNVMEFGVLIRVYMIDEVKECEV